ncbi:MAG: quinolinate synthase [Candidatus Atribacteria bacterium]|nr:quinolinate synthase [Candidatus Atribacteria bacterium]
MTIQDRIKELKQEKNAIILVHNYQLPEVQAIADYLGDSLGLSLQAAQTKADLIVFCGVYFMAETAKILSPEKTVIIPEPGAGCPMADTITPREMQELKKQHPEAHGLCYVNTSAAVKAECDIACTSANALSVVQKGLTHAKSIIFVPDKYLAHYISTQTGRDFITWEGYCPVHAGILPQHILEKKRLHPQAEILVHPECRPEVAELADYVLSTEGMCRRAKASPAQEFIVGTEVGILHRLIRENPGKQFIPASEEAICPDMKKITLEKVLLSLEAETPKVELSKEVISRAQKSIERMLQFA